MPILKQLVSGSSHSKRRSRMDLTREMISSPLGDFRHTMHVGRSGDAFGDTSFLASRSGEPPPDAHAHAAFPHSPRPGLLSRTFRSSKRSQSVSRVDQQHHALASSPGGGASPVYVKNAMSLPFLNDEDCLSMDGAKSLTSSPLRRIGQTANGNGATAAGSREPEMDERSFGELTELPETTPTSQYRGGMKRAESVMSFHIDLGPSMLGDILDVMAKDEDDLGYEEGRGSEGRASPDLSAVGEGEDAAVPGPEDVDVEEKEEEEDGEKGAVELQHDSMHAGSSVDLGPESGGPCTPEARPKHPDSHSSVSSSGSAAVASGRRTYAGDTDSATFSAPPPEEEVEVEESAFSSFLEDEDDEIRV